jgi:predicted RNase H-like HicB family nuclease
MDMRRSIVRTYYAIVHKDEDSAFGVHFPDLPGCFSAADDEDEVVANATQALAFYAETENDLPAPRGLDDLRRDPEVRKALKEGGVLMIVPLVIETKKERYNLMLPTELVEAADSLATAAGLNRSEFFANAVRREIERSSVVARRSAKRGRKPVSASKG